MHESESQNDLAEAGDDSMWIMIWRERMIVWNRKG